MEMRGGMDGRRRKELAGSEILFLNGLMIIAQAIQR